MQWTAARGIPLHQVQAASAAKAADSMRFRCASGRVCLNTGRAARLPARQRRAYTLQTVQELHAQPAPTVANKLRHGWGGIADV